MSAQFPKTEADFCIEMDYQKGSGNPSRVFRAMSDLIDALQETDKTLIGSIDAKLEPVLLLEDIETGSIRSWLRQKVETGLNSLDDDALKSGDYKKLIGAYLLKGKYAMIRFLENKTDITDAKDIQELENELVGLAEETNVKMLPAYEPPPRDKIVQSLDKINSALAPLNDDDSAKFISNIGNAEFNLTLYIAPETIEDLITAETHESTSTMIMKIKKPDFLGASQWEFKFNNRAILVTIADTEWLERFQDGNIRITPGDAIRAKVLTQVQYGFNWEVVATHYSVVEVLDIIPKDETFQPDLYKPRSRRLDLLPNDDEQENPD